MKEVSLSNDNQVYFNNQLQRTNLVKAQNYNVTKPIFNTGVLNKDTFELSTDKYAADDGKISIGDKVKNFAKGLIAPVTTMFSSPKNFLIGAGAIAVGGLLIAASGGALAPVMVAAGVIGGGIQLGKSAYKAATATTDDEACQAWQGMGTGTVAVVGSVAGAKGALKSAGIKTEGMNCIQATAKCITSVPSQIGKTVTTFTSGEAINNLKALTGNKNQSETKADSEEPVKQNNKAEGKTEHKKPKSETQPEQKPEVQTKGEVKPETKPAPKVEPKQETQVQQTETAKLQGQEPKPVVKQDTQPKQAQEIQPDRITSQEPTDFEIKPAASVSNKSIDKVVHETSLIKIKTTNGQEIQAQVNASNCSNGENYTKIVQVGDETVGKIGFCVKGEGGAMFGLPDEYNLGQDSLCIKYFATSDKYKGIGKEIIKIAVKDSEKLGYGGRVNLDACGGSLPGDYGYLCNSKYSKSPIPFYYKQGFRSPYQDINEAIEAGIKIMEKTGIYPKTAPQSSSMYLPQEIIQQILATFK